MKEFSSYYFSKVNEIPQTNYIDVAYLEATELKSKPVKQKATTQAIPPKQSLNAIKPVWEYRYE